MRIITLLTDFGTRDWFVSSLKGVILDIAPGARIVDVTHEIPPQDVRAGAFVLAAAARAFPKGTIHVAVVDPGVGGDRKAVAVRTRTQVFLAPDNGVLSFALQHERGIEARELANAALFRRPVSRTFHGRDVFAPVAAHLANGVAFSTVGPRLKSIQRLPQRTARRDGNTIRGEVIYVDHFGNLITSIAAPDVRVGSIVEVGCCRIRGISSSYSSARRGGAVAVANSLDLLEIGVRDSHAARVLRARIGTPVLVRH